MKRPTVSIPDEVYRSARIAAAQRDTSVTALMVAFLERCAGTPMGQTSMARVVHLNGDCPLLQPVCASPSVHEPMPLAHLPTCTVLGAYTSDRDAASDCCLTEAIGYGLKCSINRFIRVARTLVPMATRDGDRDKLGYLRTLLLGHEADGAKTIFVVPE